MTKSLVKKTRPRARMSRIQTTLSAITRFFGFFAMAATRLNSSTKNSMAAAESRQVWNGSSSSTSPAPTRYRAMTQNRCVFVRLPSERRRALSAASSKNSTLSSALFPTLFCIR